MRRRVVAMVVATGMLVAAMASAGPGAGADGSVPALDAHGDHAQWDGEVFGSTPLCGSGVLVECPVHEVDVADPPGPSFLTVILSAQYVYTNDFDLIVTDAAGNEIARTIRTGTFERIELEDVPAGRYRLVVQPKAVIAWSADSGAFDDASYSVRYSVTASLTSRPLPPPDKTWAEGYAIDAVYGCLSASPHEDLAGPTTGELTTVDVLLLLDGVDEASARSMLEGADGPYEALGLDIDIIRTMVVDLPSDGVSYDGRPKRDAKGLLTDAKATQPHGARPDDVDIVYVLTTKDLVGPTGSGVVGMADCIGGVESPYTAFAAGEVYGDHNATVMAHELGHLFGGHHHYSNCVEEPERLESGPCTIMSPTVSMIGSTFSTVNAKVVRGHADRWVAP